MDIDLIEILKYILLVVSAILIITLLISFITSKLKGESRNEVDAGNLIKSPEPKIVRTSNRKVIEKSYKTSKSSGKAQDQNSRQSSEKRKSTGDSESRKQSSHGKTDEEERKVTRSTGQNTPRMQVLTDLKNPNKKNIQDQYLGGGY